MPSQLQHSINMPLRSQLEYSMDYALTVTAQHEICLQSDNTAWNMPSQLQNSIEYAFTITTQYGICLHRYDTAWNLPSQLQLTFAMIF